MSALDMESLYELLCCTASKEYVQLRWVTRPTREMIDLVKDCVKVCHILYDLPIFRSIRNREIKDVFPEIVTWRSKFKMEPVSEIVGVVLVAQSTLTIRFEQLSIWTSIEDSHRAEKPRHET